MATKTLTERVTAPFAGCRVDREAGVIYGMLVCGRDSLNRRDYPWGRGLTHRKGTYEGRFVNCDHGHQSTVDRRLGWLANEQTGDCGRPRADLHVLKTHPMADRVFEAAERNPALFGLSHVAVCKTRPGPDGREVVEDVVSVESVDLVADPATTKGFFESDQRGRPVAITLGKYLEAVAKLPRTTVPQVLTCRRLSEMDGMADVPMPDDVPAPADDADPDDAIKSGFKVAAQSALDAAFDDPAQADEMLGRIKMMLKDYHGKYSDAAGSPPADDTPAEESAGPKAGDAFAAVREATAALKRAGLKAVDVDQAAAYAALPEPLRETYARDLLRAAAPPKEPPVSAGRGTATAAVAEGKTPPADKPFTWN